MHIKYPKIRRLGISETDGIMNGNIVVQEKIDGANLSVRLEEGKITVGSRTQIKESGFNGAVDYVKNHEGIYNYLNENPTHRMYGERLVQHTVRYAPEVYKKFWLFDILESSDGEENLRFMHPNDVSIIAIQYGIESPHVYYNGDAK